MKEAKELADCIPDSLIEQIMNNGSEMECQQVYRVAKYGIINDVTFMGSYEETLHEGRPFNNDLNEIGSYSTSCYLSPRCPKKFLGYLKARYFKKYPHPNIICGYTICGLSQLTIKRIPDYFERDHVDWWIYKGSFDKLAEVFSYYEDFGEVNKVEK